jgi:hypothetical protein
MLTSYSETSCASVHPGEREGVPGKKRGLAVRVNSPAHKIVFNGVA